MNLYRGYVELRNKKAIKKWKDCKLDSLEDVEDKNSYAGILAENVYVIDVDNKQQSDILLNIVRGEHLNCRVIRTNKGRHFYFMSDWETCKTGINLACGIKADIKTGNKNSYCVLKDDGELRKIEYTKDILDVAPSYLLPISGVDFDFLNKRVGDGRNSALFAYILALQGHGYSTEDAKECLRIINNYVFDEPLSDRELNTICRDDAFKKPAFFVKNVFQHDKFAQFLINEEHIKKINGQLHIYRNGVYENNSEFIECAMIKHIPQLKDTQRKETLKYMQLFLDNEEMLLEARYIAFKNGILDLVTKQMTDFTHEIIITNKLNYDYDEDAYCEITDKTLNKLSCNNQAVRQLLEECIGYSLYRRNELGKAFILIGDKSNGKSTFLDMVKTMLGQKNICSLDLQELGDRFNTAMLFNKLANIGDDISDDFMKGRQVSVFKKIVTGNRIKAENKGTTPFEFEPYTKLLFSANSIPRTRDITGAVMRRLVIIPFKATFSKNDEDYNPWIKYDLCTDESMRYLLKIGVAGLLRVLKNKEFSESDEVKAEITEYEHDNNPILCYLEEYPDVIGNNARVLYLRYNTFCLENNFKPLSKTLFNREIKKRFNCELKQKTKNGKAIRVFE